MPWSVLSRDLGSSVKVDSPRRRQRTLGPLLGERIDPDVVSRGLEPCLDSSHEVEIETALAQ